MTSIAALGLTFSLILAAMPQQAPRQPERTAFDYVQEVSQLIKDSDRPDASDAEAAKTREKARELALRYAERLKAGRPTGEEKFYRAYLYYLIKDPESALPAFREVLADPNMNPEDKQRTRLYLIEILSAAGKLAEAEAELASVPDTVFNYREVLSSGYNLLAVAETRAGRLEKALEQEERALQNARKSGMIPLIWKHAWSVAQLCAALERRSEAVTTLTLVRKDLERQVSMATGEVVESLKRGIEHLKVAMAQIEMTGLPAPQIVSSKLLGESTASLTDLKGKVVALEFWAAWCPDCRGLLPSVRDWATRFEKNGLKVLAVTRYYGFDGRNLGKASREEEERVLLNFKQARGLPYGAVMDSTDRNFDLYHVTTIPTIVVIDRTGRLRFLFTWHENPALCEQVIKRLLDEAATPSN